MANLLPSPKPESPYTDKQVRAVAELASRGWSVKRIAKKIAPRNIAKGETLILDIRRDPRYEAFILAEAHHEAVAALPRALRGAARAAARGRVDAIKWLGEVTGLHNPRVDHNVAGEIRITMDIPRPKRVEAAEDVVDADVVED